MWEIEIKTVILHPVFRNFAEKICETAKNKKRKIKQYENEKY